MFRVSAWVGMKSLSGNAKFGIQIPTGQKKRQALITGTTPHDVRDARISANATAATGRTEHSPHGS